MGISYELEDKIINAINDIRESNIIRDEVFIMFNNENHTVGDIHDIVEYLYDNDGLSKNNITKIKTAYEWKSDLYMMEADELYEMLNGQQIEELIDIYKNRSY